MRLGSPLATIRALWGDIYPANKPRKHSLIEKLFLTLITILPVLSLSNIRPQQPTTLRHVFMDIYVLAWATLLCLALTFCSTYPTIATLLAAYRLYDIVTYRLYFLFVKSQERPWTRDILRRSILIVLVNFAEVTIAFAILYSTVGTIRDSANTPLLTGTTAVYYSLLTMTTVGYGDFVPRDDLSRTLVMIQVSTSLLLLIFIVPALVSLLTAEISSEFESPQRQPGDAP